VLRERFWRAVDGVLLMSLLLYLSGCAGGSRGRLLQNQ
jgi:hypothetical protein